MTTIDPKTQTADEWDAKASESFQRSFDSFENSDTDGFLSQAAGDTMGLVYLECAKIARNGGKAEFVVPADLNGRPHLDARYVFNDFGGSWVWDDADGNPVWFTPSSARVAARRQANDLKKGVRLVRVLRPALVKMQGFQRPSIVPDLKSDEIVLLGDHQYKDNE